jgi:uncharacterized membrane protein
VDDLFFTGTGINLAKGGGLTNPWITTFLGHFGTTKYWVQPPLHSIVLRSWLFMAGINTPAILGFQAVACAILTVGVFLLLRTAGTSFLLALGSAIVSLQFGLSHGLRPDTPAAALIISALGCWLRPGLTWWAVGCIFAAAAPAMQPFATAVVVPLGAVFLFRARTRLEWLHRSLVAVSAALMVAIFLAWCLDWQVTGFLHSFLQHARFRTPQPGLRCATFWDALMFGWEPLLKGPAYLLCLITALLAWKKGGAAPKIVSAAIAGFFVLGVGLYAGYTPRYGFYISLIAAAILISCLERPERFRTPLTVSWIACACLNAVPDFLSLGLSTPEPAAYYTKVRETATLHTGPLLVDEVAARFVYDFQLPSNARDWLHSRATQGTMMSPLATKPPGEAWLVDTRKLDLYVPDARVRAERAIFLGRSYSTIIARPGELRFLAQ